MIEKLNDNLQCGLDDKSDRSRFSIGKSTLVDSLVLYRTSENRFKCRTNMGGNLEKSLLEKFDE